MKILVLNCGSSSIKYALYNMDDKSVMTSGGAERVGLDGAFVKVKLANGEKKHSNIITNCIGAGCKNSYLDLYEFTADFLPGDTYMLCSDGLNDMVDHEDIEKLMNEGATANALCEAAIEAGGFDNVSVCVFHVE